MWYNLNCGAGTSQIPPIGPPVSTSFPRLTRPRVSLFLLRKSRSSLSPLRPAVSCLHEPSPILDSSARNLKIFGLHRLTASTTTCWSSTDYTADYTLTTRIILLGYSLCRASQSWNGTVKTCQELSKPVRKLPKTITFPESPKRSICYPNHSAFIRLTFRSTFRIIGWVGGGGGREYQRAEPQEEAKQEARSKKQEQKEARSRKQRGKEQETRRREQSRSQKPGGEGGGKEMRADKV